jgi:glutamine synthetase adenylyltransferase
MEALDELQEHSHHASSDFDKRVAVTMAVIAATLAIVAVLGHLETTEELLNQQRASDQWAFYQAKAIRRYQSEVARDVLGGLGKIEAAQKYAGNMERYQKESEEIQHKAKELQLESDHAGRKALRLHFGQVFLEIAIVFASLAILTKRTLLWMTAMGSALIGVAIAATGAFVK